MKSIVSIVTPVYNEGYILKKYISKIKRQTYGFNHIEIILVDDGSSDETSKLFGLICQEYRNIQYIECSHSGVSTARNIGIKNASGKYIFFLDVDDELSSNTIQDCVEFFNSVYDYTDLVTYPIETYYKGRLLEPHFRYEFLTENGLYDLRKEPFIGQTTMNIVVKNRFEGNVLFDENMSFSEDQKYCCDVLKDKLTMGFCKTGKYIYYRSEESSSGRLSGACYIFETSLKMFEDIFSNYEEVPVTFQGLFVNDIYWKMRENIFFPYHYDTEKFKEALARVKALLRRCDTSVILEHPTFDFFEEFYIARLKGEDCLKTVIEKNAIKLYSGSKLVLLQDSIEMVLTKVHISGRRVRIQGFIKSVFFQFYKGPFEVFAIENLTERKPLQLRPSSHNYYLTHEPTQRFFATDYECDALDVSSLYFQAKIGNLILPVTYYYMPLIPLSKSQTLYRKDNVEIQMNLNAWNFTIVPDNTKGKTVWLYYDCNGVEIDNGLKQYLHDASTGDDVERYYVLTDKRQGKYLKGNYKTVRFGSRAHKKLLFNAAKIITAFIEEDNIFPWPSSEYDKYSNKLHFETIYLQHGVLHIDMPWKYSPEKIIADKVVVSSDVDYELFMRNGFRAEDLWKAGMPRYDEIKTGNHRLKKILFAPSWRKYLVSSVKGKEWEILRKKFMTSKYYDGLKSFIESTELKNLLRDNGYEMDVKLHPIFAKQDLNIDFDSDLINLVQKADETEYSLFITDFSSYMFDFIYLETPVLSYIPDYEEFACGMNGYRKVDFFDKVRQEEICKTVPEIVKAIENFFVCGKGMNYNARFFNKDHTSREKIYRKLIEKY